MFYAQRPTIAVLILVVVAILAMAMWLRRKLGRALHRRCSRLPVGVPMNANGKGTRAKRHAPAHARPRGLRLCPSYTRARKWVLGCSELRATLVSVLRARARKKTTRAAFKLGDPPEAARRSRYSGLSDKPIPRVEGK